jgi:hypothetical protein
VTDSAKLLEDEKKDEDEESTEESNDIEADGQNSFDAISIC